MIIETSKIKEMFSLAEGADENKIKRAQREAEMIDLKEAIGRKNYQALISDITFQSKYLYDTGDRLGYETAIAYLTYSRYLQQNNVTSTVAGELYQSYVNSEKPSTSDNAKIADYYRSLGMSIVNDLLELGGCDGGEAVKEVKSFKLRNI